MVLATTPGGDVTIRIGFYGAGLISRIHVFLLRESGADHHVVAVHDPEDARAREWAGQFGAKAVGEDALLDCVDAVYVTSWTSEHPRLVAKAAKAGKAVFCEKPLAFEAGAVQRMVDAVERAGVTNQVGLILRFMPPFRLLRHLLADERAGRVLAVVFRDDQFIPVQGHYASTWRGDPARAGRGTVLEHSIHDVDILQWLLGPVAALSAGTRTVHGLPGIEDVASVRFDFESGATATLTSIWHDILERPSLRHVEVFCERMHAVVEHDMTGPVRWRFTGEHEQGLSGDALVAELAARGDADGNPARTFLDAVAAGRPADPCLAAALPAHRIVDAIYASAEAGGALVTAPYATPAPPIVASS
jgi:predicted dehydrogenase